MEAGKKILYLHPHFIVPGGAGRFALETASRLRKRKMEITVASIRSDPKVIQNFNGIKFIDLGFPLSNSILYWVTLPLLLRKLIRIVKQERPDIIFSQVFPANWWGFYLKKKITHIPHVWMCQEPSAFIHSKRWIKALPYTPAGIAARVLNPILKLLDKKFAKNVDFVFSNSNFSKSLAQHVYNYQSDIISVCYPGVDLESFTAEEKEPKNKYQIIVCGKLTKFKNVDKVILALKLLDDKDFKFTLKIIGEGEEKNSLVKLVSKEFSDRYTPEEIKSKFVFLGSVSDKELVGHLLESELLIHAAEEEPFGLVPVEAMACGVPVVAIEGGGPSETIVHKETGYLCKNSDPKNISEAIEWVFYDQHRLQMLSTSAVAQSRLFSWEKAANLLQQKFNQC